MPTTHNLTPGKKTCDAPAVAYTYATPCAPACCCYPTRMERRADGHTYPPPPSRQHGRLPTAACCGVGNTLPVRLATAGHSCAATHSAQAPTSHIHSAHRLPHAYKFRFHTVGIRAAPRCPPTTTACLPYASSVLPTTRELRGCCERGRRTPFTVCSFLTRCW